MNLIPDFEDQIYDDFVERMLAAPMFPTVEREIFSPDPISELEYVSIESEEFPFSSPIAIPVPNYQPTIQPFNFDSHSVGSNEYEHESDFDETASNNESNYSMADFDLNFSEICINPGANEGFMDDQYEIFSDNEANNSMPEFKLNFTDDSINPEASVGLDSSFTGEW